MKVRIYFNQKGGLPWAVDNGPGTPEQLTSRVIITTTRSGSTVYLPEVKDPEKEPQAWVEYENSRIYKREQDGVLIIIGA